MNAGQNDNGRAGAAGPGGPERAGSRREDWAAMVAVFAHEVRSPLGVIANSLGVIARQYPGDPGLDNIRRLIERQVGRINGLVNDLLEFSSAFGGDCPFPTETVELSDLVSRAVEAAQPLIDRAGHALVLNLPDPPFRFRANGSRLVQVLANLLDNAAKYTPPGGRIVLRAEPLAAGLRITVRDNGLGISPDAAARVFEPFYRAPEAVARGVPGSGIGLAVVRRLIMAHGGQVEVRSAGPGRGTEVAIVLPGCVDDPGGPPASG
jgi:signal transduction histidine kinase